MTTPIDTSLMLGELKTSQVCAHWVPLDEPCECCVSRVLRELYEHEKETGKELEPSQVRSCLNMRRILEPN